MKSLALLIVIAFAAAWPTFGQGKLGLGGTFWYLGLTLEGFAEIPLGDIAALRLGGGMFAGGDYAGFLANAVALIAVGEAFRPYVGVEGVAGVFVRPQDGRLFAGNWLIGFYMRLGETYGLYAQVRFLKMLGGMDGIIISLSGAGFPFLGAGILVNF